MAEKILRSLGTDEGECAEHVRGAGGVCSSDRVVNILAKVYRRRGAESRENGNAHSNKKQSGGAAPADPAKVIETAAEALRCDTEACVLSHPHTSRNLGDIASRELVERFKTPGPRDTTELLSNEHIDRVLARWAREFPDFFNCPFAMMDFEKQNYRLSRVSLPDVYEGGEPQRVHPGEEVCRPCRTFACVLNTDVSSGKGKHWVALFVDKRGRDWTVEYFNSAGNPPPAPVVRWMESAAQDLRAYRARRGGAGKVTSLPVTATVHQRSRTECGPYTLFYVRTRLEGVPHHFFDRERVSDQTMQKFRRHLFRAPDS
jgi:hypothetical protein